jgi:hypothetical protein
VYEGSESLTPGERRHEVSTGETICAERTRRNQPTKAQTFHCRLGWKPVMAHRFAAVPRPRSYSRWTSISASESQCSARSELPHRIGEWQDSNVWPRYVDRSSRSPGEEVQNPVKLTLLWFCASAGSFSSLYMDQPQETAEGTQFCRICGRIETSPKIQSKSNLDGQLRCFLAPGSSARSEVTTLTGSSGGSGDFFIARGTKMAFRAGHAQNGDVRTG